MANNYRPKTSIRATEVEARVLMAGLRLIEDPETLRAACNAKREKTLGGAVADEMEAVQRLHDLRGDLDRREDDITGLIADGLLDREAARERLELLREERADLEGRLADNADAAAYTEAIQRAPGMLQQLLSMYIEVPGPGDVADVENAADWSAVADWLRSESRAALLERRDMAPKALSWLRLSSPLWISGLSYATRTRKRGTW